MNTPVMNYKLNPNNAKQVGNGAAIEEKGAYKGVFTRAEAVTSTKGTQGVEFDFKSNDGATAKYLTIWTINRDGQELYGRKMIDAIMTSMGIKDIAATQAKIKKWDANTRGEVVTDAVIFQQLMDRPVGVVIAREEYQANDGTFKWKNALICPFEAETGRIASERLENKPAIMLDKIVAGLKDKPISKGSMRNTQSAGVYDGQHPPASTNFDIPDEDFPF